MQQDTDNHSPETPSSHATFRRPLLRAILGAGALGVLGVPHASRAARAAIAGVDIDYKRCKVAFVSNASAIDTIAVYYADRDGARNARYDIAPTTTAPRGYDPLVVEYDADEDRTQIQLADPRGSLACVIAEADGERTVRTNPTDACVPAGFNTAPSASFDVSDDPTVGEPVTFTSTATDPDSPERLVYAWDLDGDDSFEVSGEAVTTTFETPGEKTVRHRVTDDCGSSDTVVQTITVASSVLFEQAAKLTASDGEAGDEFGRVVSIDGDTALVGAYREDAQSVDVGAAYVFERNQGGTEEWGEVAKLTASDREFGDQFGYAVSIDGDTALVGARGEDGPGETVVGAAYVFERDEGGLDAWGEVAKLTASDRESFDFFGQAVSIDGDTALIGANRETTLGKNAGAAYVFDRDQSGTWRQVAKLLASDGAASDQFGYAVTNDGDTALVAAIFEDEQGTIAGAAYVFERDEGGPDAWGEVAKLTASDAEARDVFGVSVSLEGDTAIVGANGEDGGDIDVGAAYVFQRNQGGPNTWGEVAKLTASDGERFDQFGIAVGIDDETALVGSIGDDDQASEAGAVYVFERNEGGPDVWGEVAKFTTNDGEFGDLFGASVSIHGNTALVGAWREDEQGTDAGAAYIFE